MNPQINNGAAPMGAGAAPEAVSANTNAQLFAGNSYSTGSTEFFCTEAQLRELQRRAGLQVPDATGEMSPLNIWVEYVCTWPFLEAAARRGEYRWYRGDGVARTAGGFPYEPLSAKGESE